MRIFSLTAVISLFIAPTKTGVIISLVEPLGGVLGESASIFCQIHGLGGASGIVLRDATAETIVETGPTERLNLGFLNATHREFILDEVRMSDDGREFICSLQEFFSPPVTFIVNHFSSISINPDSSLVDGAFTHKEGATSVIIQITVDAFPFPMPTLTKLSENENITVDSSRVFINNSEIQFLAPLNRLDAGLYTLMMTNFVDTLMESFTIDVHYTPTINPVYSNLQCQHNLSQIYDLESTVLAICIAGLYTDIVIDCQFSSNPSGNLTVIYPTTVDNIEFVNETKIVIRNFTTSNEGDYSCEVNNILVSGERGRQTLMVTITIPASTTVTTVLPLSDATTLSSSDIIIIPSSSDADIPSSSDADIPSSSDADIPSSSDADIPSSSDADIPSSSDADIPSSSDADIPSSPDATVPSFATDAANNGQKSVINIMPASYYAFFLWNAMSFTRLSNYS